MPRLFVLNPNSSEAVTASIARAVAALVARGGHEVVVDRLRDAPEGIETDAHVAEVGPKVSARIAAEPCDAAVIACFSDPGIELARQATSIPVIGIAEAAYYAALQLAPRFGVVSLSPSSVRRHAAHIARLGLSARLAGDRDVAMSVAEAADPSRAWGLVAEVGRALRDQDGAQAVILGCAGMGGHRQALQAELGLPVIDPAQAAVAAAMAIVDLGYRPRVGA